jgi:class 3 adenylate cyclase
VSDLEPGRKIDELLDRAFAAISEGDHATASVLAEQVLSIDRGNSDAEDLLAAPLDHGEIRRLTLLFADLVDSTALSTRIEPEVYRTAVGRYKDRVRDVIDRYGGYLGSTKGDGHMCVFGHPTAHENDVERAVLAGMDITREVARLSERLRRRFGFEIAVRVGVHRGTAYLDLEQNDVYGLAANMTARVCGLAPPGTVVVSAAVESLIRGNFELQELPAQSVKGIEEPVTPYLVVAEGTPVPPPGAGPLVGRQSELAHLRNSWSNAMEGVSNPAGLAFCGEAGIGKSRLAGAAVDLANRAGAVVLELNGSPFHTDVGLHPIRRLIERRCGIERDSSPTERLSRLAAEAQLRALASEQIIPLLAPVLGISPQAGYEPATADGHKLFGQIADGVRGYLLACADNGPALVLAEDMHWFDEDTVEVLDGLLANERGQLLVVMTSRDRSALPSDERTEVMDLKPLTDLEADELIVALNPNMTPQAREAVRRRCDGVPLYIDEVVAKLTAQPTDAAESTRVPDTLYEALLARVRSSRNAIRVVEAAAIIGSQVDRPLLLRTVELSEHDVDDAIRELTDGRVLEPLDAATWRFRHELLREVATELSPPSLRRRMHGRVADALVASASAGTTDWRVVAGHCERADRYDDAASAYQRASREAQRRGGILEARGYLTRGLAQVESMDPGPTRDRREVQLRLRRGFLFSAAEGSSSLNAAADFERCLQLRESGLSDDLLATLTALYGYYAIRADLRHALQVLEAVRAGVSDGRGASWPTLTAGFGMVAWYRGEFDSARAKLEEAASKLHQVGSAVFAAWFMPNDPIASVHTHLALARYIQGDLAGAEKSLTNTERRCDEVGLPQGPFSLSYARQLEVLMRIESRDLGQAAEVADELTSEAQRHGLDSWAIVGAAQKATIAALFALNAEPADATALHKHIATVTAIVDEWRAREIKSMITTYDGVIALLLIGTGQLAEARNRVDVGLALALETEMHYYDAELLRIRAHTLTDATKRTADLRAAIDLARRQGAYIFELRAAADDFELNGDPARQSLLDAVERFPVGSTWPELARARALLE